MLSPEAEARLLDAIARETDEAARQALTRLLVDLRAGVAPAEAVARAQAAFEGLFVDSFAQALAAVTGQAVTRASALSWPLGFEASPVLLSTRLHTHARVTQAGVTELIREHVRGLQSARALALRLYDGYIPPGGDGPMLAVEARRALPKWIRQDPQTLSGLESAIRRGQAQQLRTPSLRAAYEQLLDAVDEGAGQRRLQRALDVAFREKNRFFANRIAQTELHRAQAGREEAKWMADPEVEYVQIELSVSHPQPDICDLFAKVDRFGLGPGVYPKEQAPKRPFHPFCRCVARPRWGLSGEKARPVNDAERSYLRGLSPEEARRVMGSQDKLDAVLGGKSAVEVINAARLLGHRIRAAGEGLQTSEIAAMNSKDMGHRIVSGLIDAARLAPADPAARLEELWANAKRFAPHVRRRMEDGSVSSAKEYARRTFEVLAQAREITVVAPRDLMLHSTGMVQLFSKEWIVLLSMEGRIVTSYPYSPEKIQFEQRHLEAGDHVEKHAITVADREALAKLFGGN